MGDTAPFMNTAFVLSGLLLLTGLIGVFSLWEQTVQHAGLARYCSHSRHQAPGSPRDEAETTQLARLHPNVTAVIEDTDGRFHVFDTKWPTLSGLSDGYTITPSVAENHRTMS